MHKQQTWTERNNEAIVNMLDEWMSSLGKVTFDQLKSTSGSPAQDTNRAFQNLAELIDGAMPDYNNKWVALFYNLWYQPKQINVAYRSINSVRISRANGNGTLVSKGNMRFIDFGCGSLATQFGVALAIADALERGEKVSYVRIDSTDSSREMIDLGTALWNVVEVWAKIQSELNVLGTACELMDWHTYTSRTVDEFINGLSREENADVWLSALHIVYPESTEGIPRRWSDEG